MKRMSEDTWMAVLAQHIELQSVVFSLFLPSSSLQLTRAFLLHCGAVGAFRGYTKDEGRALLIKSSVLEFSKKLSCKKVRRDTAVVYVVS